MESALKEPRQEDFRKGFTSILAENVDDSLMVTSESVQRIWNRIPDEQRMNLSVKDWMLQNWDTNHGARLMVSFSLKGGVSAADIAKHDDVEFVF